MTNYENFDFDHCAYIYMHTNNFNHKILCIVPESFADTMEKYFIKYYNTTDEDFGYNLDDGGHFEKHHSKVTNIKISESQDTKKSVICLETNAVYKSISEAARKLNLCVSNIGSCCRHEYGRHTCGGYHFEYYNGK